ncbi:hypothetical protein V2J09_018896 [Rumex salicifolius]
MVEAKQGYSFEWDYVTGFHKRKKKRRKEARQKQEAVERRKRIEGRKKRKLEKEFALYGGPLPKDTAELDGEEDLEKDEGSEDDEDSDQIPSVSGTKMYDNGDYKVTVTTSEIAQEEEEDEMHSNVKPATTSSLASGSSVGGKTKKIIPVKKKPLKRVVNQRSRPKLHNKRDRRKGKKSSANQKRR